MYITKHKSWLNFFIFGRDFMILKHIFTIGHCMWGGVIVWQRERDDFEIDFSITGLNFDIIHSQSFGLCSFKIHNTHCLGQIYCFSCQGEIILLPCKKYYPKISIKHVIQFVSASVQRILSSTMGIEIIHQFYFHSKGRWYYIFHKISVAKTFILLCIFQLLKGEVT